MSQYKRNRRSALGTALLALAVTGVSTVAQAGNPDRVGQDGAKQLVYNPWGRSSGWGGANAGAVRGVESMNFNPAGLVHTKGRTEFSLSSGQWGSDLFGINSFGFATKIGKVNDTLNERTNAISFSVMSFSFGDVAATTENNPEGAGFFTPTFINISLGYSHMFSSSISGGIVLKSVTEGVPNAQANGIALDAGLQYKFGSYDRIKMGVSLRNVGPAMRYGGDGLSSRGELQGSTFSGTVDKRSQQYELPTLLNIGASYDIIADTGLAQRLTVAGNFAANAFMKNVISVGVEYTPVRFLSVRAGYAYEEGILDPATITTAYSGLSAGLSVQLPLGKNMNRMLGIDYSFRAGNNLGSIHTFGLRMNL